MLICVAARPLFVAAGDPDHVHLGALGRAGEDRIVDQRRREQAPLDAHG